MAVLEAKGITKSFPGVVALNNVDVVFEAGKVHCLIGENGAGKSTLIKALTGVQLPEEGSIEIDGQNAFEHKEAFRKIAYVPQELDLFPDLSVAENLFIPYDRSGFNGKVVNQRTLEKAALPWLERFQITAKPDQLVKDISVSEQQLLQIARAMVDDSSLLLMLDEPTTSLTTEDTGRLFEVVRNIRDEGKAIVFISHKLDELFEIGDEVTVLRNGEKVAYHDTLSDIDIPWLIEKMAGRVIDQSEVYRSGKATKEPLMTVEHMDGKEFHDFSFTLNKGEILGFSGLVGAGRSELMQAILGTRPSYGGTITLDGKTLKRGKNSESVKNGFLYLSEERKQSGILPYLSVKENVTISMIKKLVTVLGVSRIRENRAAQEIVDKYNVKISSLSQQIRNLSGGNQQKAIIGRAMYGSPKVLVFDEPTKGIDVGAKTDIYVLMKELAESGDVGIILISSEMDEVRKCSNRIITMWEGKKSGEFSGDASKTELLNAIMGVGMQNETAEQAG